MSAETPAYSLFYVKAWTALSIVLAFAFLGMFVFGDTILNAAGIVWSTLRWLCSSII
jgi:hypothetical protein